MTRYTRKSLADYLDSYDAEISALQDSKREMMQDYRAQLVEKGFVKAQIKDEIEALKRAMRRRRAIAKTSETEVEEADALADEIFIEITGPAPRATPARENIEQFPPYDPETGELTDTQEQPETRADNGANITTRHLNINIHPSPVTPPAQAIADDVPPHAQDASSAILQPPASPADDGGHPSIPTDDAREAGGGVVTPITFSQSSEAVTLSSSVAPPPPGETDRAGAESSPASAVHFDNPRCQTPDGCTFAHSRNSCWECTMAWATRPKDEQVRLWQEAMEAASETEAA